MAVRKTTRSRRVPAVKPTEMVYQEEPMRTSVSQSTPVPSERKINKKWLWLVAILGMLVLWWWKTNTWPIVAFVGGKPVTRHEINKALWSQSGEAITDSIITQRLVTMELDRLGVEADAQKLEEQMQNMKAGIPEGSSWEEELANSGFTEKQIIDQVKLFLRINKAVEGEASVSASEVDEYVKTNNEFLAGETDGEKRMQAEEILKDEKMGSAIEAWIAKVREAGMGKVIRIGNGL